MSNSQQQPTEIKQYKDFTTITNIRKLTQEAITPVVKSIEAQLSEIMKENQQLRRQMAKMDDIFSHQEAIDKKIQETNNTIRQYKSDQAMKRREDEKKANRTATANQTLMLEVDNISTKVNHQNKTIAEMNNKNTKSYDLYIGLQKRTEQSINDMHKKYSDFTKEILNIEKNTQVEYQKYVSEIKAIREEFQRQRKAIEEKTKAISLYFSERDMVNEKIQDLYNRILKFVSKDDFEGYRKSQAKMIEKKFEQIERNINEILPDELKKLLPSIEVRLKEVDKILILDKRIFKLQEEKDNLEQRVIKNNIENSNKTVKVESNLMNSIQKIKEEMRKNVQKFNQDISQLQIKNKEQIQQVKLELQEQILETIERETSIINKTIQEQVKMKQQSINSERDQAMRVQLEEVRQMKESIFIRYRKIEETGQMIDGKIESFSTRITKVRSDYELFADSIRKEMSGVIKFRAAFTEKLQEMGSILSAYGEMLLINGAALVQSSLVSQDEKMNVNNGIGKDGLTYVMNNDGIIFEFKPNLSGKRSLIYRKQKLEPKQFLRSYMYSMTTYLDQAFDNLSFLNWKQHKPSNFFNDRVMDNYMLQVRRITESRSFTRPQSYISNQNNPNNLQGWTSDVQLPKTGFDQISDSHQIDTQNQNPKQFVRTIQARSRGQKTLGDSNNHPQPEIKRNYSIKKPKGSATSTQKSRYDNFLTSRSGCRSRISQIV